MWYAIKKAYGEYEISAHAAKKDAMREIAYTVMGCEADISGTKQCAGCYSMGGRHLVINGLDRLEREGYDLEIKPWS